MTSRRIINREQRQCSQIRPHLYVSGLAALSPRVLSRFCVCINFIPGFRLSAPPHMKVVHIPLQDDEKTDLTPHWANVYKEIEEARKGAGRALVLCAMGISRSATFAIAYVMQQEKKPLRDAYKTVQLARNIICPNVGFFTQLIELEIKLRGKSSCNIIEPLPGCRVPDVIWQELYDEMMTSMSQDDRHSLASCNLSARSNNDTMSLRSLNVVNDTSRSLASFHLTHRPIGASPTLLVPPSTSASSSSIIRGPVPLQRAQTEPMNGGDLGANLSSKQVLPKSALRDKSKNSGSGEKKKKWRLSFHKDVV
ncbi:unnamed protein product [Caenorhabditis angaria]|uniref:Uncharacterized protein n=1 Tax=Caenorhabditis angaria TaxID=860376 RepID=A0A9P1IK67_9PELO|nr:unnamed protein product [Caenorhabditis angaria]